MIKHLLSIPEAPEDLIYSEAMETIVETTKLKEAQAKMLKGFEALANETHRLIDEFKRLSEQLEPFNLFFNSYPNKRVIHLAKHGKWRTRKKNINRITKDFEREAKRRPAFAQN